MVSQIEGKEGKHTFRVNVRESLDENSCAHEDSPLKLQLVHGAHLERSLIAFWQRSSHKVLDANHSSDSLGEGFLWGKTSACPDSLTDSKRLRQERFAKPIECILLGSQVTVLGPDESGG